MIRSFDPGNDADIAYVIRSHVEIYKKEYQYDSTFEDFIVETVGQFVQHFDGEWENLWILEIDGRPLGCIGIVKVDDTAAQLRWFLIDPQARGKGYGKELVGEAIRFCQMKNYEKVILWTNRQLHAARKVYEEHGFQLVETRNSRLSNQDMVEERWELSLSA